MDFASIYQAEHTGEYTAVHDKFSRWLSRTHPLNDRVEKYKSLFEIKRFSFIVEITIGELRELISLLDIKSDNSMEDYDDRIQIYLLLVKYYDFQRKNAIKLIC